MVITQKLPFGKTSYLCTICGKETKVESAIRDCSNPEIIAISELSPNSLVSWNEQTYQVVDLCYAKGFERISDKQNNQTKANHHELIVWLVVEGDTSNKSMVRKRYLEIIHDLELAYAT